MKTRFRLTGRFAVYLPALLCSAVPALFVNSLNGYGPALILLLCGVLSVAQLAVVGRRVRFASSTGTFSCARGERVDFSVVAENTARLLPAVVRAELYMRDEDGLERQSLPVHMTLSAGERRDFGYAVDFSHVGRYTAGVRSFTVRDLLGIAELTCDTGGACGVEILPRTVFLEGLPVSSEQQTESSRAVTASTVSGTDYTGVREYAFGDPIKSIHWKLSAHAGGLMTKQTESYTGAGLSVVLDMELPYEGEQRLNMADGLLEAAASLGNYAVRNGMDCELFWFSPEGLRRRAPYTAFNDFHAFFGAARPIRRSAEGETDAAELLRDCTGLYAQNNIAFCTCEITEEKLSALVSLKRMRKNPLVFYFLPEDVYDAERAARLEALKRLEQAGIPCLAAGGAADLAR